MKKPYLPLVSNVIHIKSEHIVAASAPEMELKSTTTITSESEFLSRSVFWDEEDV